MSQTLDQALEAFHSEPCYKTASTLNQVVNEYKSDGMIALDTANKYLEEIATFILIFDPINALWD